MEKKRVRAIPFVLRVSEDEAARVKERMAEAGCINRSAFARRMFLKGYFLHVDVTCMREVISLHRRGGNNLKQIAARAKERGMYGEEISALEKRHEEMWEMLSELLKYLTALVELRRENREKMTKATSAKQGGTPRLHLGQDGRSAWVWGWP